MDLCQVELNSCSRLSCEQTRRRQTQQVKAQTAAAISVLIMTFIYTLIIPVDFNYSLSIVISFPSQHLYDQTEPTDK